MQLFGSLGGLFYHFLNFRGLNRKQMIVWRAFLYSSLTESKHAHIIHVVSQLTYPTVYEKGCECLLTSYIRVNPPTKLFRIITDTKYRRSKSYET
jgi:hypothetical protein